MPIDPLRLVELGLVDGFRRAAALAAHAASPLVGSGDGHGIDGLAVRALRAALGELDVDGVVVVGEGEKDEAPMLWVGERFGRGIRPGGAPGLDSHADAELATAPRLDLAVDPIDGTRLAAAGAPGAMVVLAVAPRGSLAALGTAHYLEKHVTWLPDAPAGASTGELVARIAAARGVPAHEVRVAVQERPRNARFVAEARAAGASLELFVHGDVERSLRAAGRDSGPDLVSGIGGAPEGVLTAAAVRALGGSMWARLAPQSRAERERLVEGGLDLDRFWRLTELCGAPAWVFLAALTGCAPGGAAMPGVRVAADGGAAVSIWHAGPGVDATIDEWRLP
ncbi:fructose-bisphosphatase class II [Agromyces badenianii]|uniref:fructose-bisphosphatase class II n=1 Tax=Agromyces badenianii TaxID=2080742 RepID=UPI000D591CA6|nr:fructose-bisphosphatase class II [Agromyces badenianii]PWC02957.1 fructose-bisphosphatase class II [Agromyces badenianii]